MYYRFILLVLSFLIATTLVAASSSIYAQSPYDSGYMHGCKDAQLKNSDNWYINQPGKGETYHTQGFMQGYNSGLSDCQNNSDFDPYDCGFGSKGCDGIPYCSYDDSDSCFDDGDSAMFGN